MWETWGGGEKQPLRPGRKNVVQQNNCPSFFYCLTLGKVSGRAGRRGLTSFHVASFHCSMVTGGGSKEAKMM